jgi:hypothetical protein
MAKHTPETLAAICDRLVAHPYLKPAARSIGIDLSTLFAWLEKSRADPASLSFVWSEVEAPFHQHVAAAMRMSVLLIESNARELALNGFDEVVTFQGRVQYELDPRYIGMDDGSMATLGFDKPSVEFHRYKRDADGNAIPLKVRRKPSDALVTTVLRAHFRKLYGEHKSVSVGGGVLVVGAAQALAAPKTIDHKPGDYVDMLPIEASEEEDAKRGGYMVVGPRAKTSAEIDERERQLLSTKCVVEFREEDGKMMAASRALRSTLQQPVRPHRQDNYYPHWSASRR